MIKSVNQFLFLFLLFFLKINNTISINPWIYERYGDLYCGKYTTCPFNITYNNPYSPLVPSEVLSASVLFPYNYFYLIFSLPENQTQREFYLEAIDTIQNKTVISNGDCYFINITKNSYYELRIHPRVLDDAIIQIKFLGLQPDFFMSLYFKFPRDLWIYAYGIALDSYNSLKKSEIEELLDYDEELKEKIIKQNGRKAITIEKTNQILTNLFGKALHTDIAWKETKYTEIIPIPPLLIVTVTMAVGLEESTDSLFKLNTDEENELSRAFSIEGDIYIDSQFNDYLGDLSVSNRIYDLFTIFLNKVRDIVLRIAFKTETFSLTISRSVVYPRITLTFRFYDALTKKIFSEVEIKIELTNKYLLEFVSTTEDIFIGALNDIAEFNKKYGQIIEVVVKGVIIAVIIFVIIALIVVNTIAAAGAVIDEFLKSFELGFQTILKFAPAPAFVSG